MYCFLFIYFCMLLLLLLLHETKKWNTYQLNGHPNRQLVRVVYSLGINIKSIHSSVQILPSLAMLIHTHTSLSAAVEHCIFTKNPTLCFFALNIYVLLFGVNIINICKASYCFQYKFLYIYSLFFFLIFKINYFFYFLNKINLHFVLILYVKQFSRFSYFISF